MPTAAGAQGNIVQNFSGMGSTTTVPFQVQNRWEVRWNSQTPLKITVCTADHTVMAGTMGVGNGSFYLTAGGNYYLQIDGSGPAHGMPPGAPAGTPNVPGPGDIFRWNVQVVDLGAAGTMPQPLAAAAPQSPSFPQTNKVTPPSAPAAPAKLTEEQARAVVLIAGDSAQGTGFLVKTPEGCFVVTNIHVIADNQSFKITTSSGAVVTLTSIKCAADRDLAMLAIQDAGYSYLEMAPDVSQTAAPGDEVVTPGNSQGGQVMLNTKGRVLGLGPQRVEIDNPIFHGNSGGPIFHTKSGKVVGVVTEAMKVETDNALDKASYGNSNSAISGNMRYFGLRLDTVSSWMPIDWRRFRTEAIFLKQFHDRSRCLDSYLNGSDKKDSSVDDKAYLADEDIVKANDEFFRRAGGADISQRLEALKGLLFALNNTADSNMDQIQNSNNFYSFDQERVQNELAYRQAIKKELDSFENNVSKFGDLPRTNN